jgi:hypothetical protein
MFLSLFFFIILLFVLSLFNHFKDRSSVYFPGGSYIFYIA